MLRVKKNLSKMYGMQRYPPPGGSAPRMVGICLVDALVVFIWFVQCPYTCTIVVIIHHHHHRLSLKY